MTKPQPLEEPVSKQPRITQYACSTTPEQKKKFDLDMGYFSSQTMFLSEPSSLLILRNWSMIFILVISLHHEKYWAMRYWMKYTWNNKKWHKRSYQENLYAFVLTRGQIPTTIQLLAVLFNNLRLFFW